MAKNGIKKLFFRKSQITIFIILGVLILLAFGVVTVVQNFQADKIKISTSSTNRIVIKNNIDNCVDVIVKEALFFLGENGGYIYKPNNLQTILTEKHSFAYLYQNQKELLPLLEQISADIGKYVIANIPHCLQDFKQYKKQGYFVTMGQPKSNIIIGESLIVNLYYPMKFSRDGEEYSFDAFSSSLKQNIPEILRAANDVVQLVKTKEGQLRADIAKAKKETKDLFGKQKKINPADYLPPSQFSLGDVIATQHWIPDSTIILWVLNSKDYKFYFATELTI